MSLPWATEPPTQAQRDAWRRAWMEPRGLRRSERTHACVRRLAGLRCSGECGTRLPGDDHTEVFTIGGGVAVAVLQPYSIDANVALDLADLETEHDLIVRIGGGPAWHFPGAVLHIEVWTRPGRAASDAFRDEWLKKQHAKSPAPHDGEFP